MGPPIILVGTQRSGTTWLGEVFSRHPRVAYWIEPRHVWMYGHAGQDHDALSTADATPRIVRHIRRTFERFVEKAGKDRLMEKTPSNTLRVSFVHAVFPEAKILLVLRDGRGVIRSTGEVMRHGGRWDKIVERARQVPVWEWPAYLRRDAGMVGRMLLRRPLGFWGARPPDWRAWVREDRPEVVLAKQWAACINRALDDAAGLGAESLLTFRFEEMAADPRGTMSRIVEFVELPEGKGLMEAAETIDRTSPEKWRGELDEGTLSSIRPHVEPTLRRMGYAW
jgi:hypothetical protein